jgi:hypothetical protein
MLLKSTVSTAGPKGGYDLSTPFIPLTIDPTIKNNKKKMPRSILNYVWFDIKEIAKFIPTASAY